MAAYNPHDSEAIHSFKVRLADLLTEANLPIADAAAKLNISSERLYKYLNAGLPNSMPMYLLPLWTRMIGPELLAQLAAEAHFDLVERPRVLPDWQNSVELAGNLARECGEILQVFAKSMDEDNVTARELRQIQQAVGKAIAALLSMQVVAEAMVKAVPRPPR
jgi:hypothetical protein